MSRQVNLGNDFDVARLGVSHNLAKVVQREPKSATVFRVVKELGCTSRVGERTGADAADFGQARIFRNLNAPSLVVGEMPVEAVEFIGSHDVKHAFDFCL